MLTIGRAPLMRSSRSSDQLDTRRFARHPQRMRKPILAALFVLFPLSASAQAGWQPEWVPAADVSAKVKSLGGALYGCYTSHVPAQSRVHGDIVTLRVVVSEQGNVFRVDWMEGSTSSGAFKSCVRELFLGLKFTPAQKTSFVQKVGFQNGREKLLIEPPHAAGGAITKETVVAMANARRADFDRCYVDVLPSKPGLQGQVLVEVVVDPSRGTVQSTRVVKSTLNDPKVESCALGVVRGFAFPVPDEAGLVIVQFPLSFQPDK